MQRVVIVRGGGVEVYDVGPGLEGEHGRPVDTLEQNEVRSGQFCQIHRIHYLAGYTGSCYN